MPYGLNTGFKPITAMQDYRAGHDWGAQKAERERRQPIVEQLEKLQVQKAEQSAASGKQKITLNDMTIAEGERKKESAEMQDLGQATTWAMNQPNPEAAFDQVLAQFESEGKPTRQLQGRYDIMPMLRDLNNPDYAKQQAVQQNLMSVIQTLPRDQQGKAMALGQAAPGAFYKAYGENMFSSDQSAQLDKLTEGLSPKNAEAVVATYAGDPAEATKLRSRLALQQAKPKSATEKKEEIKADAAFKDLEILNDKFKSMLADPVFSESVGPIDKYTADIGAAFGSESGVMKKKAERAVKGLVRGLVASFPGSLSEKELTALEAEMPKTGDSVEVWADWFENDFTPNYRLAKEKAGKGASSSAVNDLVNKYAD